MIRFSTSEIYASALDGIRQQQNRMQDYYRQLSTGEKITRPSDAPVAAARVVNVDSALGSLKGWAQNVKAAQHSLGQENTQLQSATTLIDRVRTLGLQMANGTTSAQDRRNGAATVTSYLHEMMGYANAQDPNGHYLFAGTRSATQPFAYNSAGTKVQYHGDSGQRKLAVSRSQKVAVSDAGNTLFMDVRNGNGTFAVGAASSNTGTATAAGAVNDASQAKSHLQGQNQSYRIQFASSGSNGLTYTIQRGQGTVGSSGWTSSETTIASGSYQAGAGLTFDGMSLHFSGKPAAGDTFTVSPSSRQSVFATLRNLHDALDQSGTSPAENAQTMQKINNVLQSLDQAQTRIGSAQAAVGARIQSTQSAGKAVQSVQTQLKKTRSGLADANMPSVITKLDQASLSLQAASKAFVQVQGLSLFKFLP